MATTGRPSSALQVRAWDTGLAAVHTLDGGWQGDPLLVVALELVEWTAPEHGLPLSPSGPWVLPGDQRWPLAVALATTGGRCTVAGRNADAGLVPLGPDEVA